MDFADTSRLSIPYISISQVQAFERNPYYWALSYGLRIPQPEGLALIFGKTVHKILELLLQELPIPPHLLETENLPSMQILQQVIDHLKIQVSSASSFKFIEFDFLYEVDPLLPNIKGVIDLIIPGYEGSYLICDHKTVKSKKYALNSEKLFNDFQINLYAYVLMKNFDLDFVHVQHNQIFKDEERIDFVQTTISLDEATKKIQNIRSVCYRMLRYAQILKEKGLGAIEIQSTRQCSSCQFQYGGCPYKAICRNEISINDFCYQKAGEKEMKLEEKKLCDLNELMTIAKEHFSKKEINKFDLREVMAKAIMEGIKKHGADAVVISHHLLTVGDPDYGPVLSKLKENNIKTYIEVK